MNPTQYPDALTPENARELRDQRQAIEDDKRAQSEKARQQSLTLATHRGERARAAEEARERETAAWQSRHDVLVHQLHEAIDAPILRQLREAQDAVALAEHRVAESEAARP
jgi:hypothetical protein